MREPRDKGHPQLVPAPVARFARTVYGDRIPVVETAVVLGRARLALPGLDAVEALTVTFDPDTGLLDCVDTLRCQSEGRVERWGWHNRTCQWRDLNGLTVPVTTTTHWNDAAPWATWKIDDIIMNVDVAERFVTFGQRDTAAGPEAGGR